MAKSSPPIERCALCETTATLQWSHIIPKWVYRRAINMYPSVDGPKLIVVTGDGVSQYRIQQCAEYMLCASCEQRFRTWEATASELSFQIDASQAEVFPALQKAIAKVIAHNTNGVDKFADLSTDGADSLARFALSVIWRAHKSREHFPKVQLGSYADPLGALLLNSADPPMPEWVQVTLHLVDSRGAPLDRLILAPWTERARDGFRLHSFLFFGLWFQVYIGKDVPALLHKCCLSRTGSAWIGDAARLKPGIASLKQKARSVGQLAKDEASGKV